MTLSIIQQTYCYTQLCNYRKAFVSKPIKYSCDCNLSFTRSLNVSYFEMDG